MTGVELDGSYIGELDSGGDGTYSFNVTVQPGNTFALHGFAIPPTGDSWATFERTITMAFVDQTSYGTATCTQSGTCIIGGAS
jgi:hypothetical protein